MIPGFLLYKEVDMFLRGLKTNTAVTIAVLLIVAMLLIDFVIVKTAQRDLFQAEILKGYLLITLIENNLNNIDESGNITTNMNFKDNFDKMLNDAEFSCALVMDINNKNIYYDGKGCELQDELETVARQTILTGERTTKFFGTTWGVFLPQNKNMIISAPLFRDGNIVAGASILVQLEGIYQTLRRSQLIFIIYILSLPFLFLALKEKKLSCFY